REGGANRLLDTHACCGIAARLARNAEIGALRILAQGEFDAWQRAFKRQLGGGLAPTQLDDFRLSADGIGGTVENVGRGYAAGEVAVDIDVIGVDDFRDVRNR